MSFSKKYDNVHRGRKQIFVNNLIGGVAWGLGATIGVSIIVAILSLILHTFHSVPVVGVLADWIAQITHTK